MGLVLGIKVAEAALKLQVCPAVVSRGWGGGVGIRGKTGVPPRLPLFSESLALLLLLTDHSSLTVGLCSLNYYGWISFGFQDHEVLFL